jgi:hypothetical protein
MADPSRPPASKDPPGNTLNGEIIVASSSPKITEVTTTVNGEQGPRSTPDRILENNIASLPEELSVTRAPPIPNKIQYLRISGNGYLGYENAVKNGSPIQPPLSSTTLIIKNPWFGKSRQNAKLRTAKAINDDDPISADHSKIDLLNDSSEGYGLLSFENISISLIPAHNYPSDRHKKRILSLKLPQSQLPALLNPALIAFENHENKSSSQNGGQIQSSLASGRLAMSPTAVPGSGAEITQRDQVIQQTAITANAKTHQQPASNQLSLQQRYILDSRSTVAQRQLHPDFAAAVDARSIDAHRYNLPDNNARHRSQGSFSENYHLQSGNESHRNTLDSGLDPNIAFVDDEINRAKLERTTHPSALVEAWFLSAVSSDSEPQPESMNFAEAGKSVMRQFLKMIESHKALRELRKYPKFGTRSSATDITQDIHTVKKNHEFLLFYPAKLAVQEKGYIFHYMLALNEYHYVSQKQGINQILVPAPVELLDHYNQEQMNWVSSDLAPKMKEWLIGDYRRKRDKVGQRKALGLPPCESIIEKILDDVMVEKCYGMDQVDNPEMSLSMLQKMAWHDIASHKDPAEDFMPSSEAEEILWYDQTQDHLDHKLMSVSELEQIWDEFETASALDDGDDRMNVEFGHISETLTLRTPERAASSAFGRNTSKSTEEILLPAWQLDPTASSDLDEVSLIRTTSLAQEAAQISGFAQGMENSKVKKSSEQSEVSLGALVSSFLRSGPLVPPQVFVAAQPDHRSHTIQDQRPILFPVSPRDIYVQDYSFPLPFEQVHQSRDQLDDGPATESQPFANEIEVASMINTSVPYFALGLPKLPKGIHYPEEDADSLSGVRDILPNLEISGPEPVFVDDGEEDLSLRLFPSPTGSDALIDQGYQLDQSMAEISEDGDENVRGHEMDMDINDDDVQMPGVHEVLSDNQGMGESPAVLGRANNVRKAPRFSFSHTKELPPPKSDSSDEDYIDQPRSSNKTRSQDKTRQTSLPPNTKANKQNNKFTEIPATPQSSSRASSMAPPSGKVPCPKCTKPYATQGFLDKHLPTCNGVYKPRGATRPIRKTPVSSIYTGQQPIPDDSYRDHKGRPACTACEISFSTSSLLKKHINNHCKVLRAAGVYDEVERSEKSQILEGSGAGDIGSERDDETGELPDCTAAFDPVLDTPRPWALHPQGNTLKFPSPHQPENTITNILPVAGGSALPKKKAIQGFDTQSEGFIPVDENKSTSSMPQQPHIEVGVSTINTQQVLSEAQASSQENRVQETSVMSENAQETHLKLRIPLSRVHQTQPEDQGSSQADLPVSLLAENIPRRDQGPPDNQMTQSVKESFKFQPESQHASTAVTSQLNMNSAVSLNSTTEFSKPRQSTPPQMQESHAASESSDSVDELKSKRDSFNHSPTPHPKRIRTFTSSGGRSSNQGSQKKKNIEDIKTLEEERDKEARSTHSRRSRNLFSTAQPDSNKKAAPLRPFLDVPNQNMVDENPYGFRTSMPQVKVANGHQVWYTKITFPTELTLASGFNAFKAYGENVSRIRVNDPQGLSFEIIGPQHDEVAAIAAKLVDNMDLVLQNAEIKFDFKKILPGTRRNTRSSLGSTKSESYEPGDSKQADKTAAIVPQKRKRNST